MELIIIGCLIILFIFLLIYFQIQDVVIENFEDKPTKLLIKKTKNYEKVFGNSKYTIWIPKPINEYYKQYVPYYTNVENSSQLTGSNKNDRMEKLNYMIHLLEEQLEDKTSNVAEELKLYLFLGIFVIFVVDSFARAGSKYKR